MNVPPVPPETVQCAVQAECDHHWISAHKSGHRVYWVRQCSICHEVDWDGLDAEVAAAVAAERERNARYDCDLDYGQPFADLIREEGTT